MFKFGPRCQTIMDASGSKHEVENVKKKEKPNMTISLRFPT